MINNIIAKSYSEEMSDGLKYGNDASKYFNETEEGSVLFTGGYMKIYIQEEFFDKEICVLMGREIEAYGIFDKIEIWNDPEKTAEPADDVFKYRFPSVFRTVPSAIISESLVSEKSGLAVKYKVLCYYQNSIFIKNLNVTLDSLNVEKYLRLITSGYLSDDITYDEMIDLLQQSRQFNKINLNVSSLIEEVYISGLCRDERDRKYPYRMKIVDKSVNNFYLGNIKEIPAYESTFTAIAFENIGRSLTDSMLRHRKGEPENESPIEKILDY